MFGVWLYGDLIFTGSEEACIGYMKMCNELERGIIDEFSFGEIED